MSDLLRWQHAGYYFVYHFRCQGGIEYVGMTGDLGRLYKHKHVPCPGTCLVTAMHRVISAPTILAVVADKDLAKDIETRYTAALRGKGIEAYGGGFNIVTARPKRYWLGKNPIQLPTMQCI